MEDSIVREFAEALVAEAKAQLPTGYEPFYNLLPDQRILLRAQWIISPESGRKTSVTVPVTVPLTRDLHRLRIVNAIKQLTNAIELAAE